MKRMAGVIAVLFCCSSFGAAPTRATTRAARATSRPVTKAAAKSTRPATARRNGRNAKVEQQQPPVLEPISPAAQARAMQSARQWSSKVADACKIEFTEVETDHFLIFHNWDAREEGFLIENVEGCYRAISQQFGVAPQETVFAGKPPVFMISGDAEYSDAMKELAPEMDPTSFIGLALTNGDGHACMLMKKPVKGQREEMSRTEKRWASTLAHEMTHLFIARYRTNRRVPGWLNEGVAELMECRLFPELYPEERLTPRLNGRLDVARVLDLDRPRNAEEYARMQTIVETLIDRDQGAFQQLVTLIKDGSTSEQAIEQAFDWTLDDLQEAWLDYLERVYNVRSR